MPRPATGSPISSPVDITRSGADRERHEPVRVEEPDAEEEERDREGHRMDRPDRARRHPRVREVGEREQSCQPARSRDDGDRARRRGARRARRRGSARTRARAATTTPSRAGRGARGRDRRAPPRRVDLLARRSVRDVERAPLGRAPDRLHHVPEVEAAEAELEVAVTHDREEHRGPAEHRAPDAIAHTCARTNAAARRGVGPVAVDPFSRSRRAASRRSSQPRSDAAGRLTGARDRHGPTHRRA